MMYFRSILPQIMASLFVEIDPDTHANEQRRGKLLPWRGFLDAQRWISGDFLRHSSVNGVLNLFFVLLSTRKWNSFSFATQKKQARRGAREKFYAWGAEIWPNGKKVFHPFSFLLTASTRPPSEQMAPFLLSLRGWNLLRPMTKWKRRFELKFFQLFFPSQADYEDTFWNSVRSIFSASVTYIVSSLCLRRRRLRSLRFLFLFCSFYVSEIRLLILSVFPWRNIDWKRAKIEKEQDRILSSMYSPPVTNLLMYGLSNGKRRIDRSSKWTRAREQKFRARRMYFSSSPI